MVKKYEYLITDGGYHHWWSGSRGHVGNQTYKKYEAYIEVKHFETREQANMAWKALRQDWKDSIDEQEKEKNKPKNSSNENKQNIEKNEIPIKKSETTKLTEKVDKIMKDKIKPLELKEKEIRAIADKIEQESQKRIDEINRQVDKKNEENTKLAQELKRAQESGNKTQVNKMAALLQQGREEAAKLNNQKKDVITKDNIMEVLAAYNKPWYQKINYKNPRIYVITFLIILTIILIIWLIKKALSFFTNNK